MPDVSVVLPVFNGGRSIERAARSILDQTLRDIELIVVDDGSSDDTVARVRGIHDARLRLIRCDHRHVVAAANTATELAQAPLIARMDADDFSHPRRLARQVALLQQRELDVVGCQVHIMTESRQVAPGMRRYQHWINEETLAHDQIAALRFVEFPFVNPTILARRRYFEMGYRYSDFPEDYDLMLRAASAGLRFGKVAEALFDWTDRPGRLTRTDPRYTLAAFDRCRRLHLSEGPLKDVGQVDLWGMGKTGKPWLRWLQGRGIVARRAFDIDRRKVGERIHGVPVVHPREMPPADGTPLIIAVGAKAARDVIAPQFVSRGYAVGRDAWFVA